MRAHRGKFDISKPFRIVSSAAAFQALTATERLFPIPQENDHSHPKEEIAVPRIEVVPRLTARKANATIPLHYIRLPAQLILPRPRDYELSEVDWLFLLGLKERFGGIKELLDEEFLVRVVVQLEERAGRDSVLPRNKSWLVSFIERQYPRLMTLSNFEQLAYTIYNYWKSRREELRFPLWRPLWRPADNEFNHMLAFKTREKRSRNLRRATRVDETDIIQELHEEYHNAAMLCERIQLREELKLRSVQLQLMTFTQECKGIFQLPPPEDFSRFDTFKEKLRIARSSTEEFRHSRERIVGMQPPQPLPCNQRESIACFLANAIYQAERFGITYDAVFPTADNPLPALKTAISQTNKSIQELPVQEEPRQPQEETTHFTLRRCGDILLRSFSSDQEQHEAPPANFLAAKRKRVSRYYVGEDDQIGDVRDLRKVISSNFKRYQQLQQMHP